MTDPQAYLIKLLKPLVIVSFSEMILWRLMSGFAPPSSSQLVNVIYQSLRSLAPYVLNLALGLTALCAVLASWVLLRSRERLAIAPAMLILAAVQLALLLTIQGFENITWSVYQGTFLSVVLLLAMRMALKRGWATKLMAIGFVASYSSAVCFKVVPLISSSTAGSLGVEVLSIGESLALLTNFLLFWMATKGKLRSKWILLSLIPTFLFILSYVRSPWLTTALSLMMLGFSLHLNPLIYALSIWIFSYLMISLASQKSPALYALFFILLGGLMLQHAYLNLIIIIGLMLLTFHFDTFKDTNPQESLGRDAKNA